jgi:hypothetical protein
MKKLIAAITVAAVACSISVSSFAKETVKPAPATKPVVQQPVKPLTQQSVKPVVKKEEGKKTGGAAEIKKVAPAKTVTTPVKTTPAPVKTVPAPVKTVTAPVKTAPVKK